MTGPFTVLIYDGNLRWQPLHAATCHWRVFRGQRQLGHVSQRVAPRQGYTASHIDPSGRRLVKPFATLRAAATWAMFGCTEASE